MRLSKLLAGRKRLAALPGLQIVDHFDAAKGAEVSSVNSHLEWT